LCCQSAGVPSKLGWWWDVANHSHELLLFSLGVKMALTLACRSVALCLGFSLSGSSLDCIHNYLGKWPGFFRSDHSNTIPLVEFDFGIRHHQIREWLLALIDD